MKFSPCLFWICRFGLVPAESTILIEGLKQVLAALMPCEGMSLTL